MKPVDQRMPSVLGRPTLVIPSFLVNILSLFPLHSVLLLAHY